MRNRLYQYPSCFVAILASSTEPKLTAAFCQSSKQSVRLVNSNLYGYAYLKNNRCLSNLAFTTSAGLKPRNLTVRNMNSFGFGDDETVPRINREAMEEIIEDVVNGGREDSGYVIIDVRGHDEVASTGKLNEVVHTLPLPYIMEGALAMDEEDFEEQFGFEKPGLDETLVFSCKAGIRSASAAKMAQMAGYTDILDYAGGSIEWFS